jgi:alkylation response protein AidB-like acyl-CoA dehydrogenase
VFEIETAGLPVGAALGDGAEDALTAAIALAIAGDSLGGAQRITVQTIEYQKTRQQFGRALASFQALKHRAANLAVLAANNEQILAHGIEMIALGLPDALLWALLAKSEVSDGYVFTAADCVQLHGGVGFTWEFDPHIHLKRARMNEMLLAQNRIVRDLAADRLAMATRAGRGVLELPTA